MCYNLLRMVSVLIRLKPDVADPQGAAVCDALQAAGFTQVQGVRVGKLIDVQLAEGTAAETVHAACRALLVNGVIETYVLQP